MKIPNALEARIDIGVLLRAERWDKIEEVFKKQSPQKMREFYAAALSTLKGEKSKRFTKTKLLGAFQYFTWILEINCKKNQKEIELINCLSKIKEGSLKKPLQRIASLRAAELAEEHKMPELSQQFIIGANMESNDLLSSLIFQQRLGQILRNKEYKTAWQLANRRNLRHLISPFSNFLRARAFSQEGKKKRKNRKKALYYFYKAAYASQESWIRSSLYTDIKRFYPKIFNQTKINASREYRSLTAIADQLSLSELNIIRSNYTFNQIVRTSKRETVQMDGIYFIKMKNYSALRKLFQKYRDYLQNNPLILSNWFQNLCQTKQSKHAHSLLASFRNTFLNDSDIWYEYITLFDELYPNNKRKQWQQFRQIVRYLKHFPHHRRIQDLLLEKLLGTNSNRVHWAPKRYWNLVIRNIPRHTASGRFYYWLKRYYKENNHNEKSKEIENQFYLLAPSSFYAAETWSNNKSNFYRKEWGKVKTRTDYLRWLSLFGGRQGAISFLRRKNLTHLQDPKAKIVWSVLQKTPSAPDAISKTLFDLGDWQTGVEYVKNRYKNKLSKSRYLLQLTQLGRYSKNLNVQIYYLRRLLLSKKISLDPFSLPEPLAKLLYPRIYEKYVRQYSKRYKIDENIAYALMHQESLFRENAVSRSGARGLMQIMPLTGSWLSKILFKKYEPNIYDPKTNIHLGVYYFSNLIKKYKNNFRWAAIAYNGGPGNLRKWKKEYYNGDFYYFLEKLPNNESRNYCRITYENFFRYKTIYTLY